jgi:ATP-dependent helicase/nuclease subunit A
VQPAHLHTVTQICCLLVKRDPLRSGLIDLLLETANGFVIIDHKSFLGKTADWSAKALSYSGQLAAYSALHLERPIESAWIHFAAGGGLMQIAW